MKNNLKNLIKRFARFFMRVVMRLKLLKFFPSDPRVSENFAGRLNSGKKRLCVFASYSATGEVADYVLHNLAALADCGFDIVFVTTAAVLQPADREKLTTLCMRVLRRQNTGYDFGSWKAGLFSAGIDYKAYDQLLMTNDSYYGPLSPWSEVFNKASTDLYGITDSYGIQYHLMSYFVLYNRNILHSTEFDRQWRNVRMIPTIMKTLIIYAYEVGMSQKFQRAGFSISAFCAEKDLFEKIPEHKHLFNKTIIVHRFWRELIERMRCPILKVDTFWRVLGGDETWKAVLGHTGYDITLIERHRKEIAARQP
ncbi:MAG: rhamnan synthesis F family protein [Turneriella sp.]